MFVISVPYCTFYDEKNMSTFLYIRIRSKIYLNDGKRVQMSTVVLQKGKK
jgi:hypothetical protein